MKIISLGCIFLFAAILGLAFANDQELSGVDDDQVNQVTKCTAGFYLDNDTCKQCLKGTYSEAGAKECQVCAAGTREVNHLSCKDCRPGKYSRIYSNLCTPCGPGKVSQAKASQCTVCKAGEYASHSDNKCKPCEKNTISAEAADTCTPCAKGTYSGRGASQCVACGPGQYNDPILLCLDCLPSFYSSDPNVACKKCQSGKYSGRKASTCIKCAKGQFVNPQQSGCLAAGTTPPPSLVPTPPPTAVPTPDPTPVPTSPNCPHGSEYDSAVNKCVPCKAGFIKKGQKCVPCGLQYYSPEEGFEEVTCKPCFNGVVNANRTACVKCQPPYTLQKYVNEAYYPAEYTIPHKCVRCPDNTYSRVDEIGVCLECKNGEKVNADQTGCEPGPPTPVTDPPTCPAGSEYVRATNTCTKCKVGYEKPYSFLQSCTPCIVGFRAYNKGSARCVLAGCGPRDVVDAERSYCVPCKGSYYKHVYPIGEYPYTNAKEAECRKCPPNTYTPDYYRPAIGLENSDKCFKCPVGINVNAEQTGCIGWTPTPTGEPTRKACPPGSVLNYNDFVCRKCSAGFSPEYYGGRECKPCLANTYAPYDGMAQCDVCPEPKVVIDRVRCEYCPPSFGLARVRDYATGGDRRYCEKCPGGTYSGFEDSKCHECGVGFKVNAIQTGCDPTPPTVAPTFPPPSIPLSPTLPPPTNRLSF